jgi:hypothetical protein
MISNIDGDIKTQLHDNELTVLEAGEQIFCAVISSCTPTQTLESILEKSPAQAGMWLDAFGEAVRQSLVLGEARGMRAGREEVRDGLHRLLGTDTIKRDIASIAESLGTLAWHANERR